MAKKQKESDSLFFLKILMFFILGTVWLRFDTVDFLGLSAVPIGLPVGIMFASHDHFMIDRKIEYTILLVSTVISFFLPIGLVI